LFQGSRAVRDPNTLEFVSNLLKSDLSAVMQTDYLKEFENTFGSWLLAHSTNSIQDLENFIPNFSTGTTQGFDSFYLRHRHRRFKCFVGEYFYHLKNWISNGIEWEFITDVSSIQPNDAVVISLPFCDTGSEHDLHTQLLNTCEQLNVPVLVDCAYYPISGNVDINLQYNCIDTVCFSLSKAFPVAQLRIGVRYTRKDIFDGQSLHASINYNHNLSAYIGLEIMRKFGSDYTYSRYQEQQKEICDLLPGLTASKCAIFAVGDTTWDSYSRANLLREYQLDFSPELFVNRICLNAIYENWDIWKLYASTIKI
jgi:hypothetical protein